MSQQEDKKTFLLRKFLKLERSRPVKDQHGNVSWLLPNGQIHRDFGPAFICRGGEIAWFHNGLRHRVDGPAIIDKYFIAWIQEGKLHREDGPAREFLDKKIKEYWLRGKFYSNESDYKKALEEMK